jgi:predicted N-acetyltransferase YhbS
MASAHCARDNEPWPERTVIGVAQVFSDGEIQAFLAVLVVAPEHRREGVARRLVEEARARTRCVRFDVISCADPFYEQLGFRRVSGFRFAGDVGLRGRDA